MEKLIFRFVELLAWIINIAFVGVFFSIPIWLYLAEAKVNATFLAVIIYGTTISLIITAYVAHLYNKYDKKEK